MNKMESMEIKKLVFTMSMPLVISMLVQALYNIVDSIFVAGYSQDALLAVSLCYPIQTIMIAVACGINVGFNTVLARYLGQKKIDEANLTLGHGILLSILNWLIFMVLGFLFAETFLSFFTNDPHIIEQGRIYTQICTTCSFGVFIQITYERIMQATGNAFYNMIMQSIGAIINIILDPIFIYGYFGMPSMGVAGAAIATIIGQIISMIVGIVIVKVKIHEVRLTFKGFYISKEILGQILSIGIPAILMQSIMSFMTVFMNMILVQFSQLAISVFNVYYKLQQFVFMALYGMTNALVPIVAYNYGARKKERILDAIHFNLLIAGIIMLVGTIVFQLFPTQLLNMFSADAYMYELGIPALRIISLSFIFSGLTQVLCSSFQALNCAKTSLVITLLRQIIILLPLTYILAHMFGLNIGWYAFVVTEIFCCGLALFFWKRIKSNVLGESF